MILKDIEHYIEFISGSKGINGSYTWTYKSPLRLANYDEKIIRSLSESIEASQGFTDRQAAMVDKIIATYERQLAALGVDQPNHKNYRFPVRKLDRSSFLAMTDTRLELRFPYHEPLIEELRKMAQISEGNIHWDRELRVWAFAKTEFNLSAAVAIAQKFGIEISDEIKILFDELERIERVGHRIELKVDADDNSFYIANAADSLREYVDATIGTDDLIKMADMGPVLGYGVDDDVKAALEMGYGKNFTRFCCERIIDAVPTGTNAVPFNEILEWAIALERTPIFVYNPNFLKADLTAFNRYFAPNEIKMLTLKDDPTFETVDSDIKVVYCNSIPSNWSGRIPLLISFANLMHGPTKRAFMGKAEKVVYYCPPLPKR